jgi:hypothetical protein
MQSLKDTFYRMLRDRVAEANPARTVVVRGVVRPGVVVAENELPLVTPADTCLTDAFCLRWTGLNVDTRAWIALTAATCAISYATSGTAGNGGMDRGRALSAMDAELTAALKAWPRFVPKTVAIPGQATLRAGDGTDIFWGDAAFGPQTVENERLQRTATVEVFGYGE